MKNSFGVCGSAAAAKIQTNLVIHPNVSLLIDGIYRRCMSDTSTSCTNTHRGEQLWNRHASKCIYLHFLAFIKQRSEIRKRKSENQSRL